MPTVLWWGRFDAAYSRNRILRQQFGELGWQVVDFRPHLSSLAWVEANLKGLPAPDLVWVPCFRQRDIAAARRWSSARGVPLVVDPLISAYDKQVFERGKFLPESRQARALHAWEKGLMQVADLVLADTPAHADYFEREFGLDAQRLNVVYVGAEEAVFQAAPMPAHTDGRAIEVLFYGSFIALQGPRLIVEAARRYQGQPVRWTLLGQGPLRTECERLAKGAANVGFEDAIPYAQLPGRIRQADILLGVFDAGAKAGRVIPNKVFQALASGRPVVTRRSEAYPQQLRDEPSGLIWVDPGDADDLANAVAQLAADSAGMVEAGRWARISYDTYFSEARVRAMLSQALQVLHLPARA